MSNIRTIAVIDICSTKVCCCIADISSNGRFKLIGVGCCLCLGVRNGVIVDMDSTSKSVAKAVEAAEKMAKQRVTKVYVSIGGKNITSDIVHVTVKIGGRTVTYDDIVALLSFAAKEDEKFEVIHTIPIMYTVDSLAGINDPSGMVCEMLSVNVNIVRAPKIQINNLFACMDTCHLSIEGVVAAGLAAGLPYPNVQQKGNVMVVDIGGTTTTISFFFKGIFCGTFTQLIGGRNITNDIAYGFNMSFANAERIKTLHGAAFVSPVDEKEMFFAPITEDDNVVNLHQIPRSHLNQMIEARVEEMLIEVKQTIENSDFTLNFSEDIIITGGGSLLTGIKDFAYEIFKKNIHFKKLEEFVGADEYPVDNSFAVSIGMICYAQMDYIKQLNGTKAEKFDDKTSIFKKIMKLFEKRL